jgi:DNA polymerase-3 subunit gamma/tau
MASVAGTEPGGTHEYVVVARRYRPQSFADLVGQGQVSQALSNAINTHRVGHAYLFTGARGVGKTSTARIFAKALNCVQGPTPTPCNVCDICQGVAQGGDVDVLEIDGASNRGIEEIRQLRANINVRPSRARFKIYIIDEVHMLTTPAFNALLKTLEEPPEHVKFIFCTTDPEKIPITVLSRCQRFDFPPVAAESIIDRLRLIVKSEGLEADEEALRLLGRRAAGSMRDSQSLLEQLLSFTTGRITVEDVHKMLGTAGAGRLAQLATHLVNRDPAAALAELENALHQSIEIGQFAEQLLGYFRDIMAVAVGCGPELLLHAAEADYPEIKRLGAKFGLETTLAAVQVLDQAVTKMRHSFHARVLFEVAIVRICKLEDLEELAQLAANLQAGGPLPASRPSGPSSESTPESTPRLAGSNAGSNAGSGTGAEKKKDSGPVESAATIQPASAAAEAMSVEDAGSEEEAEERPPHEPATNASAPPVAPAPPAVARDRLPANLADARQLWEAALDQLEDMTADFGRGYSTVDFADSDRLVVGFRLEYNLQRSSCERPDRKQKIEQALAAVAGRTVRVEFMALASESKPVERKAGPVSRVARIREREKHPMVQQARSMFDAEIVDVVEPRAEGG